MVGGGGSNGGMIISALKPWSERGSDQSVFALIDRLRPELAAISTASIVPFNPPAIPRLDANGGFDFRLQARSGQSQQEFAEVMRGLIIRANRTPGLCKFDGADLRDGKVSEPGAQSGGCRGFCGPT